MTLVGAILLGPGEFLLGPISGSCGGPGGAFSDRLSRTGSRGWTLVDAPLQMDSRGWALADGKLAGTGADPIRAFLI